MKRTLLAGLSAGVLALAPGITTLAQSYSNTVIALKPVAYWPLAETTSPAASGMYAAANLGSAGVGGNG
jgi:hypothetical protein